MRLCAANFPLARAFARDTVGLMIHVRLVLLISMLAVASHGFAQDKAPAGSTQPAQPQRKVVPGNQPAVVKAGEDGTLQLLASNCEIYGKQIAVYEPQHCIGWWTSEEDHVIWDVEVPKAGKYDVSLEWAITDEWSNNKFVIEAGKNKLEGVIPTTGGFDKYKEQKFGALELSAGRQTIKMQSIAPIKGELADLRKVTLALPK
jgi:hypothetical protein